MPDFFDLARHYSAEERADPRHAFARSSTRGSSRTSPTTGSRAPFPTELIPEIARAGPPRLQPAGLRLRGAERRRLRPRDAGARARRLGHPLVRERSGVARHVPDPLVRVGGAEDEAPAQDGEGRDHRLLRADRARLRVEPGRHANRRDRRRRQLRPQRHEALDHERQPRPGRASSGPRSAGRTARSAGSSSRPTRAASRRASSTTR